MNPFNVIVASMNVGMSDLVVLYEDASLVFRLPVYLVFRSTVYLVFRSTVYLVYSSTCLLFPEESARGVAFSLLEKGQVRVRHLRLGYVLILPLSDSFHYTSILDAVHRRLRLSSCSKPLCEISTRS